MVKWSLKYTGDHLYNFRNGYIGHMQPQKVLRYIILNKNKPISRSDGLKFTRFNFGFAVLIYMMQMKMKNDTYNCEFGLAKI